VGKMRTPVVLSAELRPCCLLWGMEGGRADNSRNPSEELNMLGREGGGVGSTGCKTARLLCSKNHGPSPVRLTQKEYT